MVIVDHGEHLTSFLHLKRTAACTEDVLLVTFSLDFIKQEITEKFFQRTCLVYSSTCFFVNEFFVIIVLVQGVKGGGVGGEGVRNRITFFILQNLTILKFD